MVTALSSVHSLVIAMARMHFQIRGAQLKLTFLALFQRPEAVLCGGSSKSSGRLETFIPEGKVCSLITCTLVPDS